MLARSALVAGFFHVVAGLPAGEPEPVVSYARDVVAVLSKAGCNTGGCHGHPKGKGGFQLSLWGEHPGADHAAILDRERIDRERPERSDLLRKPTLELKHEGGKRLVAGTEPYEILRRWIAQGAADDLATAPRVQRLEVSPARVVVEFPAKEVPLIVRATFSDGEVQDVTRWAVYEPVSHAVEVDADGWVRARDACDTVILVRYLGQRVPVRVAFVPPRRPWNPEPGEPTLVDRHIETQLRDLGVPPSPVVDDAAFLRRVSLDLTGLPPTGDEVRAFLADPAPRKRERKVDELLGRGSHADYWATLWADLLRVEENVLDRKGVAAFWQWLREAMAENKPLDSLAREVLASRGSTYDHPPANFWRALRNPPDRAEAVAQVFLGVRLQCAQCHNHPFDRWTQDDYYRFAGLMAGVDYEIVENKREDKNDKNRFVGEQIVTVAWNDGWKDPRTGQPPQPGLLDPGAPHVDPATDPLETLAGWVGRGNDLFTRTQANRIWFRLMGRGLVDPVDDVRETNPASHPELLEDLAAELERSGYDQRHLIRLITASRAYQRQSTPASGNEWDETNYSRTAVRRWSAEQIVDSLHAFLGLESRFDGYGQPLRAAQVPGVQAVYRGGKPTDCDRYLAMFGKPARLTSSDLERSGETGLGQVFELVSGEAIHTWLRHPGNRFDGWLEELDSAPVLLETLWLEGLGRFPTTEERESFLPLLEPREGRRQALEDLGWAILNAKEFLLRH